MAGVSVSTVSRVLNDRMDVADKTRHRVQEAIDRLGFAPRAHARRLVAHHSQAISLLFPASVAALTSLDLDFVIGAATATGERDYFFNMVTETVSGERLLHMYRSRLVDGVILMQILLQDWRVNLLAQQRLPFVMIGRPHNTAGLCYIDLDFEAAVGAMFDFLVAQGHRTIAFLGRPQAALTTGLGMAVRTQMGFKQAIKRHGLVPIAVQSDLNADAMAQATYYLLDAYPELTAIITTTGPATVGVIRALHQRGKAIPDEISVMTISTNRVADILIPALTNVRFPSAYIGYEAASMLIRRLDEQLNNLSPRIEQILIPAQITVRASTAPPKQQGS
jgi:DNA-binding LacI/PurR family transcriptional regulator